MKVYMIGDTVINLALVKIMKIGVDGDCIFFHFKEKNDFIRVEVETKEIKKIFQECFDIMKKED